MDVPSLSAAPVKRGKRGENDNPHSPKKREISGWQKLQYGPCDCEGLSQVCIDWIETLARVQHNREQSNNTIM